nr:sensor domain-containing protein [Actinomadura sp. CNU-125]
MNGLLRRSADGTVRLAIALRTAVPALLGLPLALLVLALVPVTLPWLPRLTGPLRALANAERRRAGRRLGREIPEPYRPAGGPSVRRGLELLRSADLWRDVAWLAAHGTTGVLAGVLAIGLWPGTLASFSLPFWWWAVPAGSQSAFVPIDSWPKALTLPFVQAALYLFLLLWVVPRAVRWQAELAETLLRPTRRTALTERVEELTETRAGALEAHAPNCAASSVTCTTGRRRNSSPPRSASASPTAASTPTPTRPAPCSWRPARAWRRPSPSSARWSAASTRRSCRTAGSAARCGRSRAGSRSRSRWTSRPRTPPPPRPSRRPPTSSSPRPSNVARHSGARRARVTVRRDADRMVISVRDDGKGGADPARGTGLAGIRRRVAALDGAVRVHSPDGEGTTLDVDLPCGS